jgi:hypothetical protein
LQVCGGAQTVYQRKAAGRAGDTGTPAALMPRSGCVSGGGRSNSCTACAHRRYLPRHSVR